MPFPITMNGRPVDTKLLRQLSNGQSRSQNFLHHVIGLHDGESLPAHGVSGVFFLGSPSKVTRIAARRVVAGMKRVASHSFRARKAAHFKYHVGNEYIPKSPTVAVLAPEVGPLHALVRIDGAYQHINPGQSFPLGGTSSEGVSVAFHPVVVHGTQPLGVSGPGAFIECAGQHVRNVACR